MVENDKPRESEEQKEQKQGGPAESQVPESKEEKPEEAAQLKPTKDSRNMAMLCHLLAIFTSFVGPLVIWLIKKDEDTFVAEQGKESLNFQITVMIAMVVAVLLIPLCVGIPLTIAVPIVDVVFCIIASVKSSSGERYRYPIAIRFLK